MLTSQDLLLSIAGCAQYLPTTAAATPARPGRLCPYPPHALSHPPPAELVA